MFEIYSLINKGRKGLGLFETESRNYPGVKEIELRYYSAIKAIRAGKGLGSLKRNLVIIQE